MPAENRAEIEAEIGKLLLEQWDPNSVRGGAETAPYAAYAHEIYGLLARGASDSQVGRRLHQAEVAELNHPELAQRDLSALLRALRKIEKRI